MFKKLAVILISVLVAACQTTQYQGKNLAYGMVHTEGVTIRAENGSFVLRSGERFTPPFKLPPVYSTGFKNTRFDRPTSEGYTLVPDAVSVRVTVPNRSTPLYGKLALFGMWPTARGPASRSYLIQVPDSYVQKATGGRVSLVYEKVDWSKSGKKGTGVGWALWLSDTPL